MRWNREKILDEIRELHSCGDELNFASIEENHLDIARAAAWHYGTWKQAVELAGIDYESVRKYRLWTRERVLEAIRRHHRAGQDLSWRSISREVDPPLSAAALRPGIGFDTWREAVLAAGIDPDQVGRYRYWTKERVISEIQSLSRQGRPLSSKRVQESDQSLFCAATRRFKNWSGALQAAGIDPDEVNLRLQCEKLSPSQSHLTDDLIGDLIGATKKATSTSQSPDSSRSFQSIDIVHQCDGNQNGLPLPPSPFRSPEQFSGNE